MKATTPISSLILVEGVKFLCNSSNIGISILQQWHTELQLHISKICVVEVAIMVVCEVLDVVDYAGIFLTRDNLK